MNNPKLTQWLEIGLSALVLVVGLTVSATSFAEGGPHHKFTPAQKATFDACLQKAGVTPPPAPTAASKAAFKACRQTVAPGDHEAFQSCMQSKGVTLPPPPTQEQKAAFHDCREQAMQDAQN